MTGWRAGNILVPGGHLTYHRTGGGQPLLLSHGLTDNGLCWRRLAVALEANFDVIMLDARGHGGSARVPDTGAYDPAADIKEAIEALALEAPILIGHSVGARATAAYANTHGHAAKVILEDPPFVPLPDASAIAARRQAFRDQVARLQAMSIPEITAIGSANHPQWHPDDLADWATAKLQVDPNAFPVYATPWQSQIDRIEAPTLLIRGDAARGSLTTPAIADEAMALNSRIETVAIDGAGHNIRRENFPAYLAAVRAFIRR